MNSTRNFKIVNTLLIGTWNIGTQVGRLFLSRRLLFYLLHMYKFHFVNLREQP